MRGAQHHLRCPASTRCSMRWSTRRNSPHSISARLRVAIGGGAAVQSEVARRWREITGSQLVEGYGLTEASPVVCINPFMSPKIGTVGLPVPSTEVTIRDDDGKALAVGEAGEVWVRGPQVMQGYWRRPDETKRGAHRRRLAADRRYRRLRRAGISETARPQEGHDQCLRLQGVSQRGGGRRHAGSRRARSGGDRRAGRAHRRRR